ncbi:MAG: ferredoxin [Planctomycetota bacterium]|nr:MAG: ferredoxin [Planctomycetota bacterium]
MSDEQGKARGWHKVAVLSELPRGEGLFVECGGKELALFRDGEELRCLEDSCPHRGGSLADGRIIRGAVACPWHSWRYRLEDGHCESLPCSQPAKSFPVRVAGDEVYVRLDGANPASRAEQREDY